MNFDDFYSQWINKRTETSHTNLDLVIQYVFDVCSQKIKLTGTPIDLWFAADSRLLSVSTKQTDSVQKGDVVVLYTTGHTDNTPPGHIGIATGNGDPNSIEILEQDAIGSGTGLGRDSISTSYVARNRVAGSFRLIPSVVKTKQGQKPDDGHTYTVLKYEKSIVTVARKLGIPIQELLEHNQDDNFKPYDLLEGQKIHLPYAIKDITPQITYEQFLTIDDSGRHVPITKLFHLKHDAPKWSFGYYRSAKDITQDKGLFPKNKELELVAIAYVPVGGEDRPYAYVMDALSYGDYASTGKIKYTRGFSYADLEEGPAPEKAEEPELTPAQIKATAHIEAVMAHVELPTEPLAPVMLEPVEPVIEESPNAWRATYRAFPDGPRLMKVNIKIPSQSTVPIYNLENDVDRRLVKSGGKYKISGTVYKDGVEFGRFERQPDQYDWIAIPMSALTDYEAIFDEPWPKTDLLLANSSQIRPIEKLTINGFALAELTASRLKIYGIKLMNKGKNK